MGDRKLVRYLKQPSTIKGIVALLAAVGVSISPAQSQIIMTAVALFYGFYQTFRDEDK